MKTFTRATLATLVAFAILASPVLRIEAIVKAQSSIAFDAATNGGLTNPGSSKTFAHTTSGSDRILFVGVFGSTTDVITGVTYAGVSMNLIAKDSNGDRWAYLFYLAAPATGSNNVVISASASGAIYGGAASYTGASQTGIPDAFKVEKASATTNITTVADNSWVVSVFRGLGGSPTAGTGLTNRITSGGTGFAMFDQNGPNTPAGSTANMTVNTPGTNQVWILASFAPAGATTTGPCTLMLLGVGKCDN